MWNENKNKKTTKADEPTLNEIVDALGDDSVKVRIVPAESQNEAEADIQNKSRVAVMPETNFSGYSGGGQKAKAVQKKFFQGGIKNYFKKNYVGWLFNSPLTIGLIIFTFIPAIYSLYLSFWQTNGLNQWNWRGIQNYVRIFTKDRVMGQVMLNTFYYVFVSVPLSLVASYLLAALVNTTTVKGVKIFRILYYLPCMIPAVASTALWLDMTRLGADLASMGLFNQMAIGLGLSPSKWMLSEGPKAIASLFFVNMWGIGGGMILWLSAFKSIDKQLYEAADIEGCSRFMKFVKITIPMSTPMIFYNMVMSLIGSIQYNGSLMYTKDGKGAENSLFMLGVHIYRESFVSSGSQGYAAALAWFMLIIIAVFTAVVFKTSKWVFYGEDA